MNEEEKKESSGAISRRDLLKVMTVAPAAALVPLAPAVVAARQTASAASASAPAVPYKPRVFDPHQWKTLATLCDLVIPADARSGSATQAGVPAFIDDWVNLKGGLLKTEVLGGLMWLDVESNRLFGHDFVDSSPAEQKQVLDRVAYPETAAPEDANAVAAFGRIRELIVGGFFSSEIGVKDLQFEGNRNVPVWDGCPKEATSRLGVDYSNWQYWNKKNAS